MRNSFVHTWWTSLTLANRVTLLRIIFIPLCLCCLLAGLYGLGALLFLVLSFSDAIDGYIARKYNQVSDLGKMLDPLADKLLVVSVLIVLTAAGRANPVAVLLITARELIIASIRGRQTFAASQLAKWKTVAQIVAITLLLLNIPLGEVVLWLAVALSLWTGGLYLWQSQR